MAKVIFVGDCHLKATSPISRKDDYPEVILDKITWVGEYAKSIGCKDIFFLGDVFDSPHTSLTYMFKCMTVFKDIKDLGINLYSIVGNHEIRNEILDTFRYSPLGILAKAGFISIFRKVAFGDVDIVGYHYPEKIPELTSGRYTMCCAHRYFEQSFGEFSLNREDLTTLGYNAYILGHDHVPYDTIASGQWILVRPGSLCRNSSDGYNKLRGPRVLEFDTDSLEAVFVDVPYERDVFFDKKEKDDFVSMTELVNYMQASYKTVGMDIREFVESSPMPTEVKGLLTTYFNVLGA